MFVVVVCGGFGFGVVWCVLGACLVVICGCFRFVVWGLLLLVIGGIVGCWLCLWFAGFGVSCLFCGLWLLCAVWVELVCLCVVFSGFVGLLVWFDCVLVVDCEFAFAGLWVGWCSVVSWVVLCMFLLFCFILRA